MITASPRSWRCPIQSRGHRHASDLVCTGRLFQVGSGNYHHRSFRVDEKKVGCETQTLKTTRNVWVLSVLRSHSPPPGCRAPKRGARHQYLARRYDRALACSTAGTSQCEWKGQVQHKNCSTTSSAYSLESRSASIHSAATSRRHEPAPYTPRSPARF